jgi:hypothetical protein
MPSITYLSCKKGIETAKPVLFY